MALEILLLAAVAIGFTILLKYIGELRRIDQATKWVKSPPVVPLLGNLNLIRNNRDALMALMKISEQYEDQFKIYLGPFNTRVFITDVDLIQELLSSNKTIDKGSGYKNLHNWLGFGLLTSTGGKWQKRRKLITPTFHFKILEQFVEIFDRASSQLVKSLKSAADSDEDFDIYPYVTLCTLDIICESAMGIKVNAQLECDSKYVTSIKDITNVITKRSISPLKMHDFMYFFTIDSFYEKSYLKVLHGMTDGVIKSRRIELERLQNEKKEEQDDNKDGIGMKKRSPFLDTLIQSTIDGSPLSDQDIREEVDTFMFEGHDTTSSGICFTLYCLSRHEDVQSKVIEELDGIFADDRTRSATYNDLQDMKYLEMVIKESLRLFPPVPNIGRRLNEDFNLNGKHFPANSDINAFIMGVHMNPKIYPEPSRFDPERFTIENQSRRHPYAYVPFSAGPRNCIGQKYAMLELKSTVSKILRHYRLLPAKEDIDLINQLVLKSKTGIKLKLKLRK